MPSQAFQTWSSTRLRELDEIEAAHQQVGGRGRGRRFATQQINHAYAVLLSSQFQGFCRDLHSEAVDHIANAVRPPSMQPVLLVEFTMHRKLDRGNPNPGNIGADFNRLGLEIWNRVVALNPRNPRRREVLDLLTHWRNAIAHQDFAGIQQAGTMSLRLATIQQWRRACQHLAEDFDRVVGQHLHQLTGANPW